MKESALAIATHVIGYASSKGVPVALFVHAEGYEMAPRDSVMYRRCMIRFPHFLVGLYDDKADRDSLIDDIKAMADTRYVA